MWKFQNFSATQIIREITSGKLRVYKMVIFVPLHMYLQIDFTENLSGRKFRKFTHCVLAYLFPRHIS